MFVNVFSFSKKPKQSGNSYVFDSLFNIKFQANEKYNKNVKYKTYNIKYKSKN